MLVTNTPGIFPKRAPIGVYDPEILCAECEAQFSRCDSYAVEALVGRFDELFKPVSEGTEILAYRGTGIDQGLLQTFFVGTLWRASVSTQQFYGAVRLGKHEETAKSVFLGTVSNDIFATVLSNWTASEKREDLTTALINPFWERWDGVNAYRFSFGRITAYIKVDQRHFGSPFREIAVGVQPSLWMTTRDFDRSHELGIMKMVAKESASPRRHGVQQGVPADRPRPAGSAGG